MRNHAQPVFQPLSKFAVSKISERGGRLQSRDETIETHILAPDLFRLRIARGKAFSDLPSWAVAKTEWDPIPAKIRAGSRAISIETNAGKLLLRLSDGSWKLLDRFGNEVFS